MKVSLAKAMLVCKTREKTKPNDEITREKVAVVRVRYCKMKLKIKIA